MKVKKYFKTKNIKKVATSTLEQQVKLLVATFSAVVIHRGLQYLGNRFPSLGFLRTTGDRMQNMV